MIFQGKNYHRNWFVYSANQLSGNTYNTISNFTQYLQLKEKNQELRKENIELRSMLDNSIHRLSANYLMKNDTLYHQKFSYRDALVIQNNFYKKNNFITIGLGSREGIQKEMGVITNDGVVGIVSAVSENYATVISLLNSQTTVSCKVSRNNATGILQWDGVNPEYAKLMDLPLSTKVYKGDTILTSGYSSVFPSGIIQGIVSSVKENKSTQMLDVTVKLKQKFNQLSHVYVIENLHKTELDSLQKQNTDND
jgi:rod shape-determining protein MreC